MRCFSLTWGCWCYSLSCLDRISCSHRDSRWSSDFRPRPGQTPARRRRHTSSACLRPDRFSRATANENSRSCPHIFRVRREAQKTRYCWCEETRPCRVRPSPRFRVRPRLRGSSKSYGRRVSRMTAAQLEGVEMREAVLENRNRWIVAAAGAALIVIALLLLFRFPAPTTALVRPSASPVPAATVHMARSDDADLVVRAEAQLRDLRPLFLPTERNAALPEPRLEPGRTFLDNETLKLTFTDAEAQISKDLPPVVTLDGKPMEKATAADVLAASESRFMATGFGRNPVEVTAFTPRAGFLEVTRMKDGGRVLSQPLPIAGRAPSEKPWAPLELIAVVDAAGLVSPLVVTDGSRVDGVDSHFRRYLAEDFRIGERLTPGFYRLTWGP